MTTRRQRIGAPSTNANSVLALQVHLDLNGAERTQTNGILMAAMQSHNLFVLLTKERDDTFGAPIRENPRPSRGCKARAHLLEVGIEVSERGPVLGMLRVFQMKNVSLTGQTQLQRRRSFVGTEDVWIVIHEFVVVDVVITIIMHFFFLINFFSIEKRTH